METTTQTDTITLPVDKEHGGIRVVVVFVFIIGWVLGYMIVNWLIAGSGVNLIALALGFVIAYLLTAGAERLLKERWPSGRTITVDDSGMRTALRGQPQTVIDLTDEPVSVLLWRFQTQRRSRVPKGWSVLALGLERDGDYLTAYTFMSPDQVEQFQHTDRFTTLKSRKESSKAGSGRDDLLLAGEQKRLHEAEQHRWYDGAELTREDFERLYDQLRAKFPGSFA